MHESVMKFVKHVVSKIDLTDKRVLEVGSYNVNGSVKPLFAGAAEYIGVDMREGKDVDYVRKASELWPEFRQFDIVVSTEMLEHDPAFWLSMRDMGLVLKTGGHLILTARGNGFPLHEHPSDYWRFMPESFRLLFNLAGCRVEVIKDDPQMPGLFGVGVKV